MFGLNREGTYPQFVDATGEVGNYNILRFHHPSSYGDFSASVSLLSAVQMAILTFEDHKSSIGFLVISADETFLELQSLFRPVRQSIGDGNPVDVGFEISDIGVDEWREFWNKSPRHALNLRAYCQKAMKYPQIIPAGLRDFLGLLIGGDHDMIKPGGTPWDSTFHRNYLLTAVAERVTELTDSTFASAKYKSGGSVGSKPSGAKVAWAALSATGTELSIKSVIGICNNNRKSVDHRSVQFVAVGGDLPAIDRLDMTGKRLAHLTETALGLLNMHESDPVVTLFRGNGSR